MRRIFVGIAVFGSTFAFQTPQSSLSRRHEIRCVVWQGRHPVEESFVEDNVAPIMLGTPLLIGLFTSLPAEAADPLLTLADSSSKNPLPEALVAFGHYAPIILVGGTLLAQRMKLKYRMPPEEESDLAKADVFYALSQAILVATGYYLTTAFGQGFETYQHLPLFWAKVAATGLFCGLSLFPSFALARRNVDRLRGLQQFAMTDGLVDRMKFVMNLQIALFLGIPLLSSLSTQGILYSESFDWRIGAVLAAGVFVATSLLYGGQALLWDEFKPTPAQPAVELVKAVRSGYQNARTASVRFQAYIASLSDPNVESSFPLGPTLGVSLGTFGLFFLLVNAANRPDLLVKMPSPSEISMPKGPSVDKLSEMMSKLKIPRMEIPKIEVPKSRATLVEVPAPNPAVLSSKPREAIATPPATTEDAPTAPVADDSSTDLKGPESLPKTNDDSAEAKEVESSAPEDEREEPVVDRKEAETSVVQTEDSIESKSQDTDNVKQSAVESTGQVLTAQQVKTESSTAPSPKESKPEDTPQSIQNTDDLRSKASDDASSSALDENAAKKPEALEPLESTQQTADDAEVHERSKISTVDEFITASDESEQVPKSDRRRDVSDMAAPATERKEASSFALYMQKAKEENLSKAKEKATIGATPSVPAASSPSQDRTSEVLRRKLGAAIKDLEAKKDSLLQESPETSSTASDAWKQATTLSNELKGRLDEADKGLSSAIEATKSVLPFDLSTLPSLSPLSIPAAPGVSSLIEKLKSLFPTDIPKLPDISVPAMPDRISSLPDLSGVTQRISSLKHMSVSNLPEVSIPDMPSSLPDLKGVSQKVSTLKDGLPSNIADELPVFVAAFGAGAIPLFLVTNSLQGRGESDAVVDGSGSGERPPTRSKPPAFPNGRSLPTSSTPDSSSPKTNVRQAGPSTGAPSAYFADPVRSPPKKAEQLPPRSPSENKPSSSMSPPRESTVKHDNTSADEDSRRGQTTSETSSSPARSPPTRSEPPKPPSSTSLKEDRRGDDFGPSNSIQNSASSMDAVQIATSPPVPSTTVGWGTPRRYSPYSSLDQLSSNWEGIGSGSDSVSTWSELSAASSPRYSAVRKPGNGTITF